MFIETARKTKIRDKGNDEHRKDMQILMIIITMSYILLGNA